MHTNSAHMQSTMKSTWHVCRDHSLHAATGSHARQLSVVHCTATQQRSELDLSALYNKQAYQAERTIGCIEPVIISGKGLGLQATQDIMPGELIFASVPLGIAYGPAGTAPSTADLVKAIQATPLVYPTGSWLQLLRATRQGGKKGRRRSPLSDDVEALALTQALMQPQASVETLTLTQALTKPLPSPDALATSHTGEDGGTANGTAQEQVRDESSSQTEVASLDADPGSSLPSLATDALSRAEALEVDADAISEAVSCNSYSEACEDIVVAELRDVDALSFTGLWPELALVNHSCAPNASQLVIGSMLFLRATRPILEGQEVTTCYLGQTRFTHVAQRRSLLAAEYGFHCQCERCVKEHYLFPTRRHPAAVEAEDADRARSLLASSSPEYPSAQQGDVSARLMQGVLDRLFGAGRFRVGVAGNIGILEDINLLLQNSLVSSAQDAATALSNVPRKQQVVLQRVEERVAAFEAELDSLRLSSRDKALLMASIGGLISLRHELVGQMTELVGPEQQLDALKRWLDAVDAVGRGSDAHMFLAVQHQARARVVHGAQSEEARLAGLSCAAAHYARYGRVPVDLLRKIVQVRSRMATGSAMASRISAMAWDLDRRLGQESSLDGVRD